jgi:hypothetical protein
LSATWTIKSFHGAGGTAGNWPINGRFSRDDSDLTSGGNSVQIPSSGVAQTWRKLFKVNFDTTPAGSISNLRAYDGVALPTGVKLYGHISNSYTRPSVTDETLSMAAWTDMATLTGVGGSVLMLRTGTVLTNPATGLGTQDYLELILQIGPTAFPALLTNHSVQIRWDEV